MHNESAWHHLCNEAEARGVGPVHLIFALRAAYPAHLARQPLADLIFDTSPYNAGTTTADAIWVRLSALSYIEKKRGGTHE